MIKSANVAVKCAACDEVYTISKGQGWDTIPDVSCPKCGHQHGAKSEPRPQKDKAPTRGRSITGGR